jgi:hypothetical protein
MGFGGAWAEDPTPPGPTQSNLVKQANAPISSIFQIRLQDTYVPRFTDVDGQGNTLSVAMTMPLPKYRLLPLPQLSIMALPAAVTLPNGMTGLGDLRFLDIAVLDAGHGVIWGVGPTFVFPTASERTTGQGKFQVGPAAAIAYAPARWLVGVLAEDLLSFAGADDRPDVHALVLQPFVTYQLGRGWFLRSQPRFVFDWENGTRLLPLDVGAGRVFRIGGQNVSCFVAPSWFRTVNGAGPRYGITFGVSLLYPNFWDRAS